MWNWFYVFNISPYSQNWEGAMYHVSVGRKQLNRAWKNMCRWLNPWTPIMIYTWLLKFFFITMLLILGLSIEVLFHEIRIHRNKKHCLQTKTIQPKLVQTNLGAKISSSPWLWWQRVGCSGQKRCCAAASWLWAVRGPFGWGQTQQICWIECSHFYHQRTVHEVRVRYFLPFVLLHNSLTIFMYRMHGLSL